MSSQDTFPSLAITIRGLDDIILVGHKLPDIPIDAIMPLVYSLRDIGVEEAKATLEKTAVSEKSTGKTAELMTGLIDPINFPDEWLISIGPDTRGMGKDAEYPKFVELGSGAGATINKNVQILPYPLRWGFSELGEWRFIGIRKPKIEGHPWMENTRDAIVNETKKLYGKEVYKLVGALDKKRNQIDLKGVINE